jgi:hypothetical protein
MYALPRDERGVHDMTTRWIGLFSSLLLSTNLSAQTDDDFRGGWTAEQNGRLQLTPDRVAGLWIAGTGPAKQNFIFRRKGDELYGMVCGPCDNTNAMAPLDGIVIDGTQLHFNIVHEDWGIGIEDGVFNMVSVGSIAASELHFTAVRDTDATGREAVMTLLGPIEYQQTE